MEYFAVRFQSAGLIVRKLRVSTIPPLFNPSLPQTANPFRLRLRTGVLIVNPCHMMSFPSP